MANPFRIGIAGLGTVGGGVVAALQNNKDLIASRAGRPIEIAAISARERSKKRDFDIHGIDWVDNAVDLAQHNGLDCVVELIGGANGPARTLVEHSLKQGRAVVTANKAMLAEHGRDLARLSEEKKAPLLYEAAVAGGIPIIKALREGLAGNRISAIYGILNGTCNYILTTMRETGRDFADVLVEAQAMGYAEADPTFDVDGIDAAHKLALLTALGFGVYPDLSTMTVRGIRHISAEDIRYADELGFRIKLLGVVHRGADGRITQTMEPTLVPVDSQIGMVDGVYNAVMTQGDFIGSSLLVGRGAGAGPTASAVISDLVDLARGVTRPVFGVPATALRDAEWGGPDSVVAHYYMHLRVLDKPGVLADISSILRDHNISVESVLQHSRNPDQPVSIVMTTHAARQSDVTAACAAVQRLDFIANNPTVIRCESF